MRYHRRMASTAALTGPALREAKRAMRAAVIERRDALAPIERAAGSQAIAARVLALPQYAAAPGILLTLPFRSEWDTTLVAQAALDTGRQVVVPRVDTAARVLVLHRIDSLAGSVVPGYRGIPEPRPEAPRVHPEAIALALVPGVAFDATGARLGYGGGYYDRLLPLLGAAVPRIAGAFDIQLVDAVPSAAHDLTVDVVVTPTRQLTSGERRA
jgi:5-formyltetrahydrofolate cyclo-ligase